MRYESSVAFRKERIGRWVHVSTTIDPISNLISHYINGRSFSREKIESIYPLVLDHVYWAISPIIRLWKIKKYFGKIDEFVLFQNAYTEIEVRRLFEVGTPYEQLRAFGSSLP